MKRNLLASALLALSILLITTLLQAQSGVEKSADVASLEQLSDAAYAAEDWHRFMEVNHRLHDLRPYEPKYMYNLVRAHSLLGDKTSAYDVMVAMQRQGISYDFNKTDDTLNIRKTELYNYLSNMMIEAGEPLGLATAAFVLPGDPADFRSISWDSSREKFLVGTLRDGKILAVSEDGSPELLLEANEENGLWSINGLAVDEDRNRLWVSSAATSGFSSFSPVDKNRGALIEFNLETLELVARYNLPVDALSHELGSIAITNDGHVYVIDRAVPIIYRKTPEGTRLEGYIASKDLVSLTDIAVTPDNSRLFVSDTVKGIFVVDPIAEKYAMLEGLPNLNLGGIEAVEYRKGELIIVQGRMKPQRLMRLTLSENGAAVGTIGTLALGITGFDRPGQATIRGNDLFYFANSGAEDSSAGLVVMRTPLDLGDAVVNPTIEDLQRALKPRKQ